MDDDRQIEAELQRIGLQGVSAFRFRTPEQRVKVVDFDVCQNTPKLSGYHSNVPWAIAKLMKVL